MLSKMTPERVDQFWAENPHLRHMRPDGPALPRVSDSDKQWAIDHGYTAPVAPNPAKSQGMAVSAVFSDKAQAFMDLCCASEIALPEVEYRFAPPRRWRMDFAWPAYNLFLEVQGGIFTEGRHTRGAALLREWEKLNTAAGLGWRVLFCQPCDLCSVATIAAVRTALDYGSGALLRH